MSLFYCLEAVMFASNTSMQDVTDSLGWSERGLKWTKKIIFGLALRTFLLPCSAPAFWWGDTVGLLITFLH